VSWLALAILGYLAAQLAIGLWVAPKIRTEDDYLVAGRRLGYPLTIFSIFATWFGAETCIASAGRAYRQGVSLTTAEPFAYGLCLVAMGLVFAAPLWRRKLTTLADLFRERYSPAVERTAALIIIPSSLFWAAAQLRGFAHVLTTVTPLDVTAGIGVAAGFCILYTTFGGLLADAITDLVQGVLLVLGLVVVAVGVVIRRGGPAEAFAAMDPARIGLVGAGQSASFLGLLEEWAIPICGSVVAAELVSRVIAARSPQVARNGAVIAGGMYIAIGLVPVFVGLAAVGLVPAPADAEGLLPAVALAVLPSALYVIFAGGLISAILSTVDTILLVTGGLAAHNLAAPLLRITDERARLKLARAGVVLFGVVAYLLAVRAQGVGTLVEQASAFGSAGILVVVCFGLFTRKGGAATAMATLVAGLVAYVSGVAGGIAYPFLTSLAVSVVMYGGGVGIHATREATRAARRVTSGP
jgi:Na+/proline symporter